jgi:hypothetical protein
MRKISRRAGKVLVAVAALYAGLSVALYAVMLRPPSEVASVFAHVPWPFWVALPMRPMWLHARAGALSVGDPAPPFDLASGDGKTRVSLESLRGRPAVLVFGSYT